MGKILTLLAAILAAIFGNKTETVSQTETPTAATTTTTAAVKEAAESAAKKAALYTQAGDVVVEGIYRHYAENDTGATKPYDNLDPSKYPDVWVRVTGVKAGGVILGLKVDGRTPTAKAEMERDDVAGYVGGHSVVVLPYPKYTPYRTAGTHEVAVLVGRVMDGETDVTKVEWVKEYPFDVTVVKA